jgi:hypothetical protein
MMRHVSSSWQDECCIYIWLWFSRGCHPLLSISSLFCGSSHDISEKSQICASIQISSRSVWKVIYHHILISEFLYLSSLFLSVTVKLSMLLFCTFQTLQINALGMTTNHQAQNDKKHKF